MEKLLTKREVCNLLGCSSRTFDRWRALWRAKGISVGEVKIGKCPRFVPSEIERLLKTPKMWVI